MTVRHSLISDFSTGGGGGGRVYICVFCRTLREMADAPPMCLSRLVYIVNCVMSWRFLGLVQKYIKDFSVERQRILLKGLVTALLVSPIYPQTFLRRNSSSW